MIDTGSPSFIRKHKGKVENYDGTLKLGDLHLDNVHFIMDSLDFPSEELEEVYGIIGHDILSRYNFKRNWDDQSISFYETQNHDSSHQSYDTSYTTPFLYNGIGAPKIKLSINKSILSPSVVFDTGNRVYTFKILSTIFSKMIFQLIS